MTLTRVQASRYVSPLREGGSLPGLIEADNCRLYVVKMRGAGQGPLVLVAEIIAACVADALHLNMPQLAIVDIPPRFGASEPDTEVRELLRNSFGANAGLAYLAESTTYDQAAGDTLPDSFAERTVWLDSFLLNVDRTVRNPNLLMHRGSPFLIDNGAALYPQHNRETFAEKASLPFTQVRQHLLLPSASAFAAVAEEARRAVTQEVLRDAVHGIPDDLWPGEEESGYGPPQAMRELYLDFLSRRLTHANIFEEEVLRAQRTAQTCL